MSFGSSARPFALSLVCLVIVSCAASGEGDDENPRSGSRGGPSGPASGPASGPNANPASAANPSVTAPRAPTASSSSDVCASAIVQTAKNMPTIVFVIDGSGSMCAPFGMSTRWQALRSALLDPKTGFIYRLQSSVYFGATLYDGTIDASLSLDATSLIQNPPCALLGGVLGGKNMGMCPQLLEAMPPKLSNAQAIDMVYPNIELGGSTPTDRALDHVMKALIAGRQVQGPDDPTRGPVYVILATDGAPNDICVNGTGGDGSAQRQAVIAAVDRGAAAGITTWVISLADGDPGLQMHLDEVARHGEPKNPAAHTFSPSNPDELLMTLAQLLGGAVGCHISLNGTVVVGQECLGTVEQNAVALPCCERSPAGAFSCAGASTTAPNGWYLNDPRSIELVGDACAKFLLGSGSVLSARFPCRVFTPQ